MEFDITDINFGYSTIYETVTASVKLTNKSILCQPFGFVKLPDVRVTFFLIISTKHIFIYFFRLKYVDVQPNDGFGTLLPNETITLDINFSPKVSKEFKFSVVCKSLVNRQVQY